MNNMNKKLIKEIVFVLIAVVIFIDLTILLNDKIILSSPTGYVTSTLPHFEWKSNLDEYTLLVDNIDDFTSPEINERIIGSGYRVIDKELEPGTYYWKVLGYKNNNFIESSVKSFTILSKVAVSVKNDGSEYEILNEGNVQSNVDILEEDQGSLAITGNVVLDPKQSFNTNVSKKTIFEVSQK